MDGISTGLQKAFGGTKRAFPFSFFPFFDGSSFISLFKKICDLGCYTCNKSETKANNLIIL